MYARCTTPSSNSLTLEDLRLIDKVPYWEVNETKGDSSQTQEIVTPEDSLLTFAGGKNTSYDYGRIYFNDDQFMISGMGANTPNKEYGYFVPKDTTVKIAVGKYSYSWCMLYPLAVTFPDKYKVVVKTWNISNNNYQARINVSRLGIILYDKIQKYNDAEINNDAFRLYYSSNEWYFVPKFEGVGRDGTAYTPNLAIHWSREYWKAYSFAQTDNTNVWSWL